MTFEVIHAGNVHRVIDFLAMLGQDGESRFRYFRKRPVEVVLQHRLCVVGLENNQPVAYGHLDPEGEIVWLGIAVAETGRGRGLGRQMMGYLIENARRFGEQDLWLTVDKDNDPAIRLYESMGFSRSDESDAYFQYRLTL